MDVKKNKADMEVEENQKNLIVKFAMENQQLSAVQVLKGYKLRQQYQLCPVAKVYSMLKFIRDDPEGILIKDIVGDGIINYVFLVKSRNNNASVILKYGEETMRSLPDEKLSLQRQELEYNCLCLMHSIRPGSVPQPFHHDKNLNILAMEDMSDWELLGSQLERRHVDLAAATYLGQLLGTMHSKTLKDNVSAEQWLELQRKFGQAEIKEFIRALHFDRVLVETDPFNKIPETVLESHRKYVKEIEHLGFFEKMNDLYNKQICFIHGGCHYKSIFVKDGQTALFDFEFAFLGHPAFNIGFPIAGYILNFILDIAHATTEQTANGPTTDEFKASSLQAIRNLVEAYLGVEKGFAISESSHRTFLSHLLLTIGCVMFFISIFGELDKLNPIVVDSDRGRMLDVGFRLMKNHDNMETVDQFMEHLDHTN